MKRASTVVTLCDNKVLLVKRKASARFMAARTVFPGGLHEDVDGLFDGIATDRVAALRELFEEAGILITRPTAHIVEAELLEARTASTKDPAAFVQLCRKHSVVPDIARLKPWSKCITPKQEKYRYDTSFFVLRVNANEAASAAADKDEVTQHFWMTPREALDAQLAKTIDLAPPTWLTLVELMELGSEERIFASERLQTPIEPELVFDEDADSDTLLVVALPGDCKHPQAASSSAMRRIVQSKSQRYRWVDTVAGTHTANSNF